MKKIISMLLVLSMAAAFAGCGKKDTEKNDKPQTNVESGKPAGEAEGTPTEETSDTLGNALLATFNENAEKMELEALANEIVANPVVEFAPVVAPAEEGLLTGFGNTEIKGFKSGYMFAPMIGTIPFIGYVFELENEGDTAEFISNLKENANLNWNICTEADEMVTGSKGNKVFFVMCPTDFEE